MGEPARDRRKRRPEPLTVLALDSSAAACSVAVVRGKRVLAHRVAEMARGHAEAIVPMLREALADAGLSVRDLDLVAATVGPGSFTGLRVGLAAARALALALRLPVVGVSTLEALAHAVPSAERAGREVLAVLDTKRGDLYAQRFDSTLAPLAPPKVATAAEVLAETRAALVAVGDGIAQLREAFRARRLDVRFSLSPAAPDATHVARVAARRLARGEATLPPRPLYLRPPEARISRGDEGRKG